MQVIEAPKYETVQHRTTMFLGGGISNCYDWQKEFLSLFKGDEKLTIFNPRRENFDVSNPKESELQIDWEYKYLRQSHVLLFWFPHETLCPITLFELGSALQRHKGAILVGCHPDYKRAFDVKYQVALERGDVEVQSSLKGLYKQWTQN